MNAAPRAPWSGALQIIRFNWPTYLLGAGAVAAGLGALAIPGLPRAAVLLALLPASFWLIASVLVSHWVYDLSPLADWAWLPGWLAVTPGRWILIQTGFDSTHGQVAERLPTKPAAVVDLYGRPGVGGGSVRRARAENAAEAGSVGALPEAPAACDTVLAIFSLHEIRAPEARVDYFKTILRALAPGGRLVLVEHLRDWRNFAAFGPGFVHFHSEREWRRCADAAGFRLEKSTSVTPFVKAFCWSKP